MKVIHSVFSVMLLLLTSASLRSQPSNVYAFLAPGGATCCGTTSMTVQFGAGGEAVVWKGVGLGAELGVLGSHDDFGGTALGVLSLNGYYHFIHRNNLRLDPFVTGGYTLLFRSGTANLFNFGGGATYWFHPRFGARLEFRDHVYAPQTTVNYWGFRVGLAFH